MTSRSTSPASPDEGRVFGSSGGGSKSAEALGLALALVVAATVLFWWPVTDRLDLPKQAVLLVGAIVLVGWLALRRQRLVIDLWSVGLFLAPVVLFIVAFDEAAARVEGWASWVAAVAVVAMARGAREEHLKRPLGGLCVILAVVALVQALGVPFLNGELVGFEGRRVVGTLGGPGHLGWTLSLLLPWLGGLVEPMKRADGDETGAGVDRWRPMAWRVGLAVAVGALVLSGSRTGWFMAAASAPVWLRRKQVAVVAFAAVLGTMAAVSVDVAVGRARLSERLDDLSSPSGTTRGRLYIWQVHLSAVTDLVGLGFGPEGFQRRWPAWQRSFLESHPEEEALHSDLRHAHADFVEVFCDFGAAGLIFGLVSIVLALIRGPPRRGSAQAGLVAVIVGGLTSPVLFFAPTLALAAICLGLRLGRVRKTSIRQGAAIGLFSLLVAAVPLGSRVVSESIRSRATEARGEGRLSLARELAIKATSFDDRNPRAWMELGIICDRMNDGFCSREAFARAASDLPSDAVLSRAGSRASAE